MAEGDTNGGSALEWVKGLGLPIASLIASAAFFGIQMQQQAFERKLNNIENGYQFYFEKRTGLQTASDDNTEIALLQMLGSAFPNVYCNVRADMHARVTAVEVLPDADDTHFREEDRALLITFIVANRTPERPEFRTDFGALMPWAREPDPTTCTADFDLERERVASAEGDASAPPPPTSSETPAGVDAPPAATEAPASDVAVAAPPSSRAPTVESIRERGQRELNRAEIRGGTEYSLRTQTYQVFFHLREGSSRRASDIDPLRAPLATANFRVMRGVRTVNASDFPSAGVVRYFGADQEQAANELVAVLSQQFPGVTFHAQAIGAQYPNMPPSNIEVWIP